MNHYLHVYHLLNRCRRELASASPELISLIPATVWLFDNYHLMYHQLKDVRPVLLSRAAHSLPCVNVNSNHESGLKPRIAALAQTLLEASDCNIDEEVLPDQLNIYQDVTVLTSQEIWLLHAWIRMIVLIRLTEKIEILLRWLDIKQQVENLVDDLEQIDGLDASELVSRLVARKSWLDNRSENVWKAQLILKLRRNNLFDDAIMPLLNGYDDIENEANSEAGISAAQIIAAEEEAQSVIEREVSSLIISLKTLSMMNWVNFFEKTSQLEAILRQDPAGVYALMDQDSRDYYRRFVTKFAARAGCDECQFAEKLHKFCIDSASSGSTAVEPIHNGTALLGWLAPAFARSIGVKRAPGHHRGLTRLAYAVSCITASVFSVFLFALLTLNVVSDWRVLLIILPAISPLVGGGLAAVNMLFSRLVKPQPVMSMDFIAGLPDSSRTFVVMPVIFADEQQIRSTVKMLETHYLANSQKNLYFAVLGDLSDAAYQENEQDQAMSLRLALEIDKLNKRYQKSIPLFYGFMRQRCWNSSEHCWMGWERKRGKLEEFNQLLRGKHLDTWGGNLPEEQFLQSFCYVLTLDADTELVQDSAAHLVGMISHPLNYTELDAEHHKLKHGYAILQSAMKNRLGANSDSLFSKLFSAPAGLDPYASVSSDIYQDTFHEGIYVGKGIYSVDAMENLVSGNLPDNHILSHDLLESCYARCAFVSNVQLMDRCPSGFLSYMKREHRWIRGDWQLLPWVLRRSSRLSILSRWKIFDNIRRSLESPSCLLVIVAMILLNPYYLGLALVPVAFAPALRLFQYIIGNILSRLLHPFTHMAWRYYLITAMRMLVQEIFCIAVLPYRACNALDAAGRALYRMIISHHNLLQWQTAAAGDRRDNINMAAYYLKMWPCASAGVFMFVPMILYFISAIAYGNGIVVAAGIGSLWILSPAAACALSRKRRDVLASGALDKQERTLLIRIALDSWHYYAEQADESTGWLAPDNWQEQPGPRRSDKTSPTNIGMQLNCVLAAYDFGFAGMNQTVEWCEQIMHTVILLEKYRGHLYNWYELGSGSVLQPDYISTVDSGNLLAAMITLRQGLDDLKQQSPVDEKSFQCLKMMLEEIFDDEFTIEAETAEQWRRVLKESLIEARLLPVEDDEGLKTAAGWLKYHVAGWLEDIDLYQSGHERSLNMTLADLAAGGGRQAQYLIQRIDRLRLMLDELIVGMDFTWLYDNSRQLFRIGYRVGAGAADNGCYDLLASEARLASFLAIAGNDVPYAHWKSLGRPLTLIGGLPALVSWSGSLFEYLLPDIYLDTSADSILGTSSKSAVKQQIRHGHRQKIPWGISESQYYRFDQDDNYQYRAFGVDRLRLMPSRSRARVTAPYATLLAMMVSPVLAMINLRHLIRLGARGRYGLYEAIDFTSAPTGYDYRMTIDSKPEIRQTDDTKKGTGSADGQAFAIVRSFMAHHLGMGLLSLDNLLNENIIRRRFHSAAAVRAASSMLEETLSSPLIARAGRHFTLSLEEQELTEESILPRREFESNIDPAYHVLANNRYQVVINSMGEGFSQCDNIRINNWQSIKTSGPQGQFIYLRDLNDGSVWSATAEPACCQNEKRMTGNGRVLFGVDKAEFSRSVNGIMTNLEITVDPQEPQELRRLFISNQSKISRSIEITSFLEPVLTSARDYQLHPAFHKLFLETEYIADRGLLICHRRVQGTESEHFIGHQLLLPPEIEGIEFEIDRMAFVGRDRTLRCPEALSGERLHGCRAGFSPDSVLSLRTSLQLAPGTTVMLLFITGYGNSRSELMRRGHLSRQSGYDAGIFSRALIHARLKLRYLGIGSKEYNQLLVALPAAYDPIQAARKSSEDISKLELGQSGLWRFGISGDYPLIVLQIEGSQDFQLLDRVLKLYEVWSCNLVRVDLVIICDEPAGYHQELFHQVMAATEHLRLSMNPQERHQPYVIAASAIDERELVLIRNCACLLIGFDNVGFDKKPAKAPVPGAAVSRGDEKTVQTLSADLDQFSSMIGEQNQQRSEKYGDGLFWNGTGYFSKDGKSYEIRLEPGVVTPRPWSNVIANENFGILATDNGAGYTWAGNSQSCKLTPWSNDPVLNPAGETILIQDKDNGSITYPCRYQMDLAGHYNISHRFGHSVFTSCANNLEQQLTVTVDIDKPVRYWQLRVKNNSHHQRSLRIVLYASLVLGVHEEETCRFIETAFDQENQLITAVNRYQTADKQKTAFLFTSDEIAAWTTDRQSYFGDGGTIIRPMALLDNNDIKPVDGSGRAPCAVVAVDIHLHDNEIRELVFGLGMAQDHQSAICLADSCRSNRNFHHNLERVSAKWQKRLGQITINSQDKQLDLMFNGWLLYQVISCRLLSRAAFYQCGGAYGFRDQLQDSLALLPTDPQIVRTHLLRSAARQFVEGDVQHWWHEDIDVGVRTRISDDLLWLPYTIARYIRWTGDYKILDEQVPWLVGELLTDTEHDRAFVAGRTEFTSSMFEHAIAAIKHALKTGSHGLPLIKGGDWNDGMNLVGANGQGESVWLCWFFITVLDLFGGVCRDYGLAEEAKWLRKESDRLLESAETNAWDGQWYLRGWFDNQHPLGSRRSLECRIDSISQSWAVICGRASRSRVQTALESADRYLVKDQAGTILLLAPPFDGLGSEPGYIRRYYPGVRENGGQYTHAAVWLAMAWLRSDRKEQGLHLLKMINPISHSLNPSDAWRFQTEPYVLPADIYEGDPYSGYGGWSWYTGSASWYYQTILHDLIGLTIEGDTMYIRPRLTASLLPLTVNYRLPHCYLSIVFKENSAKHPRAIGIWLDQKQLESDKLKLPCDNSEHHLIVYVHS
jgi:cellobiose phosphorylase